MSARRPRLGDRLEDAFLGLAVRGLGLLGLRVAIRAGAGLGRLGYRPFHVRRKQVEANLRIAYPERDARWIRQTAEATYAHLGREAVSTLLLARRPEALLATVSFEGLDVLRRGLETGRGVLLLGGHLGNWELGVGALALSGLPVSAVVRSQRNPLFDRRIVSVRRGFGIELIPRGEARREALDALRSNRIVVLIADQDARRSGVFVPFFNRPASTPRGPAILARRAGAMLAFFAPVREPDGRLRMRIEPLDMTHTRDSESLLDRVTTAYVMALEKAVRAAPEQYLWHHRRWKTSPPESNSVAATAGRRP